MSIENNNKTCAFCHAYMFEDDDIVYCPTCGAPHHRNCYNEVGHCALNELHGTDKQYDKLLKQEPVIEKIEPQTVNDDTGYVKCAMCGEEFDSDERACPNCGAPNMPKLGGFAPFDLLGGVSPETDMGQGVTANEAKQFVFSNTQRYIPKFLQFKNGIKSSWNWAAFLFPCGWFLSRKMYLNGLVTGVLSIVFTLLSVPFSQSVNFSNAADYASMVNEMNEILPKTDKFVLTAFFIGFVLNLVLRIISALWGDRLYYKHTLNTVKDIKTYSDDISNDIIKKGGVSVLLFILGVLGLDILTNLIITLV
ncbi:MAG: DUF2628 domain-containing protein [Clostridia bacterium]|nr:DUF2628 domain-containing protein [Clostridia bacterium]